MARNNRNTAKPHMDPNGSVRAQMALDLRIQGFEWEEVASKCGYANKGTAYNVVYKLLDRHENESAERYRRILTKRMEKLHTVYFSGAMGGETYTDRDGKERIARPNPEAAAICLQLYDKMMRLHGLEVKPDSTGTQNVRREYAYSA